MFSRRSRARSPSHLEASLAATFALHLAIMGFELQDPVGVVPVGGRVRDAELILDVAHPGPPTEALVLPEVGLHRGADPLARGQWTGAITRADRGGEEAGEYGGRGPRRGCGRR